MTKVAIAAAVTGSAALNGTLKLQACVDHGQSTGQGADTVTGLTNWVDIAGTSTTITADGPSMWNLSEIGFKWVRLVYTRTAGTGTLAIRAHAKGE